MDTLTTVSREHDDEAGYAPELVLVDPDSLDGVEIEADDEGEESPPPAKQSELMLLCKEYIEGKKSRQFVNRLAVCLCNDDRVRKICRVISLRHGVPLDRFDDVMQEMAAVFFDKMLVGMDDYTGVYAIVHAITKNVTREMHRKTMQGVINHVSFDEMMAQGDDLELHGGTSLLAGSEMEDLIDRRRADERMLMAMERLGKGDLGMHKAGAYKFDRKELAPPRPVARQSPAHQSRPASASSSRGGEQPTAAVGRRARQSAVLSKDQQELVNIKKLLGVRHQDFALMLDIGQPALSSYTYGRTAGVPAHVMRRARQLMKENPQTVRSNSKFLKPMSAILAGWERRIGTNCDADTAIALGVVPMTIQRWRSDETKPDIIALGRYSLVVAELERKRRARKAAAEAAKPKKKL